MYQLLRTNKMKHKVNFKWLEFKVFRAKTGCHTIVEDLSLPDDSSIAGGRVTGIIAM